MSRPPILTRADRAQRHQRIAAAYRAGQCSRTVAALFGLSDSHVRAVVRLYECARQAGRHDAPRDDKGRWA